METILTSLDKEPELAILFHLSQGMGLLRKTFLRAHRVMIKLALPLM